MPTRRLCHSVSAVDGKIYSMGGGTSNGDALATLEEYDPITDTWTRKASMTTARWGLSSSAVDGKIYAVGGALVSNVAVPTVEEYDTGLSPRSPDFNSDGIVDSIDMCILVEHWQTDYPLCDIAPPPFGDGIVDVQDLIEVAEHLFEEIYPTELIAYWKLDEAEGDIAFNSTSDNHGILIGSPTWQPEMGKVDGALELDGIDDYIDADFVLNPADGPFSILAWIKGGAAGQVVLSQTGGANWLSADPSEGNFTTELVPPTTRSPLPPLVSEIQITDGNWHHIGFVWDGSHRTLYVDGVIVAEDTQDGLAGSENGLNIGAGQMTQSGTFFSGLIDDVRIYNRAVSP
jgi:hypothetical protein